MPSTKAPLISGPSPPGQQGQRAQARTGRPRRRQCRAAPHGMAQQVDFVDAFAVQPVRARPARRRRSWASRRAATCHGWAVYAQHRKVAQLVGQQSPGPCRCRNRGAAPAARPRGVATSAGSGRLWKPGLPDVSVPARSAASTRPSGPEPLTLFKSMPRSRARLRASGVARSSVGWACVADQASRQTCAATGAGASATACGVSKRQRPKQAPPPRGCKIQPTICPTGMVTPTTPSMP